jgi:UDP-2,3-diacylglucosamine pyrophosphatase LpxH
MSLHDSLLLALESVADVKLMASLRDERLMFDRANDLRLFIPDLHLISDKARQRYRYGTNQIDLLGQVLNVLQQFQTTETARGNSVTAYQLGDCLDLWREDAKERDGFDAASVITDANPKVMRGLEKLKTRFLLGNHDFELYRRTNFSTWARRYFLTQGNQSQHRGVVLHGDLFDWVERFPNEFNRWAVYFLSTSKLASDYKVSELSQLVRKENSLRDFSQQIAGEAAIGDPQPATSTVPDRFNVTTDHKFLKPAHQACHRMNKDYGQQLRFTVIGHTHQAKISVHDGGKDDFFALIDSGAWIEDSVLPNRTRFANAQLTALSGNEVRIYQLGPRQALVG